MAPRPPVRDPAARVAGILAALAVVTTGVMHVRGLGGAFLSDDFSHLYIISHMDREHLLARWVYARFFEPWDWGNFAYRPITFLSYATDWRVFGTWAAGWRMVSLALHLTNAALVYCVASRWMFGRIRVHAWAMLPAAMFAAFPFAGEAVFWPVGYADILAAFFSILFLATLDGAPHRASTNRQAVRVALILAALLSKESALPLPVVALIVDLALSASRESASKLRIASCLPFVTRDLAPSWVTCAAYIAWRSILFGTPLKVYTSSTLAASPAEYLQRLASYRGLLTRQPEIDPSWSWALGAALLMAALIIGAIVVGQRRNRRVVPLVYGCSLSALIYVGAPALTLAATASIGDGARNFYVAWIYIALAVGLAATLTRLNLITGLGAIGWMLVAQEGSLHQWQTAAEEMRGLLMAIPSFSKQLNADEYALLLVPDHVGVALFGRNAETAIATWPIQTSEYLTVMAGMTELDIPLWREHFVDGSIAKLKGTRDFDMTRFAGVFCRSSTGGGFTQVAPAGPILDFDTWASELAATAARSNCMRGTLSNVH